MAFSQEKLSQKKPTREVNLTEHSVCDAGKKNKEMPQIFARAAERKGDGQREKQGTKDMGTQYTDALVIRGYFFWGLGLCSHIFQALASVLILPSRVSISLAIL
jgi:hypothetical protein